jgi:tetratricopeptide (TPR) repeat protein
MRPFIFLPTATSSHRRHANAGWIVWLTALFWLGGCVSIHDSGSKPLNAQEQAALQAMLEDGAKALAQATNSDGGSASQDEALIRDAVDLFNRALALAPANAAAQRGLEQALEQYVALAQAAGRSEDFDLAKQLLAQAKAIDAGHPSIEPAEQFIASLENASIVSVRVAGLSSPDLSRIIDALVAEMNTQGSTCRFRIFAASDVETRELYSALRQGFARQKQPGRPRASTAISTPKRLERICYP